MMKIKNNVIIVSLLLLTNILIGQESQYQFKRPIQGVQDQWHSISIPQDILDRTNASKSDIRIIGYDKSGKEVKVPYLLESLKSQEVVEEEYVDVFNESTLDSIFVYVTKESTLGQVNTIDLDIGNTNFDGRVKLEGKDGDQWYTILKDYRIFSFNKASNNYKYTSLEIPESDYKTYRISLSDMKDPILNSVSVAKKYEKPGKYYNVSATLEHIEEDDKKRASIYNIVLDSLSRISELNFDIVGGFDHYRRVELRSIVDSVKSKSGWKKLKKRIFNGALISYEDDQLHFDEQLLKTIEMTVYNLDDQPLQINSVKVSTPQYKLIARFESDLDFYLTYGNVHASAPHFDLSKFKDKIPDNLIPLKLGQPNQVNSMKEKVNFFIPSSILYAIMGFIIAVIGWFTIRMLSSDSLDEE